MIDQVLELSVASNPDLYLSARVAAEVVANSLGQHTEEEAEEAADNADLRKSVEAVAVVVYIRVQYRALVAQFL